MAGPYTVTSAAAGEWDRNASPRPGPRKASRGVLPALGLGLLVGGGAGGASGAELQHHQRQAVHRRQHSACRRGSEAPWVTKATASNEAEGGGAVRKSLQCQGVEGGHQEGFAEETWALRSAFSQTLCETPCGG